MAVKTKTKDRARKRSAARAAKVKTTAPAERQNLTIQLARDTIRKAKVLAAKKDLSISRFVAETIEEIVRKEDDYWKAYAGWKEDMKRLRASTANAPPPPLPESKRDEIYAGRPKYLYRQ